MRQLRPWLFCLVALFVSLASTAIAQIQSAVIVDETHRTTLPGTVHPLAVAKYDQGPVAADLPLNRLILTLARPAAREQALQQFLRDAHSPASPSFHQWLTPGQFGDRFGALPEDSAVVTTWLQSHGLTVNRVALNGTTVEFSGTSAQVTETLHTPIHNFAVGKEGSNKTFYANTQEISLPTAIHSRVASIAPINSLTLDSYAAPVGPATWSRETHRANLLASPETEPSPDQTLTSNNQPFYALAPEDFSTQYNLAPIYSGGTNGAGQTIGIIGTSNINLALVDAYRKLFNLPADHTQVIVDGSDPGDPFTPNIEAFLDVEVSGAVAPAATVNLYIAGNSPLQSTLEIAALRAVEDNQASVLSISYGSCEQQIGTAGNQFWNSLWEQAAAQGQTVFVSSGDSGPTTCTLVESTSNGGLFPVSTLSVNGIASTPWNVAVGGTDFYYSDYATGGSSISTLWNASNDASNGSLKAPLPEQPWDNALGLNIVPFSSTEFSVPSPAGGGGLSNCSTSTSSSSSSTPPTCVSGYPKPAWQSAPGVPDDQARDLPDVSLFAANGPNRTAWSICADPGNCTPSSTGEYHVFLVGGTSASSPAMAGVMALIDQKYGRQGQANFTLYALARKDPTLFHDITLGTNDVLCDPGNGSPCASPVTSEPAFFGESFGLYAAGPGYDLATGLGSIDAGKLFASWNSAPAAATSTTLQVSPTTFAHGTSATVTTTVTPASGSVTPTGNTVLTSSTAAIRNSPGTIPLVNGTATTTLSTLPGGTYTLTADYSGDGTFAASTSSPVTLTVTPEASATTMGIVTFLPPSPTVPNPVTLATEPYGSQFYLQATPSSAATSKGSSPPNAIPAAGAATGTVTFTDSSTSASTTVPLSVQGVATWSPQNLTIGAHSVTAAYSGDPSFSASTSVPLALTVVKGTPELIATPESSPQISSNNGFSYSAGSNFVVHVLLRGAAFSNPPTGNVTVTLGSNSQTVALNSNEYQTSNVATAFITFPTVAAGTYALAVTYAGDTNWASVSLANSSQFSFAATSTPATTSVLTLSPSTVDSSGSIVVTATVTDTTPQTNSSQGFVTLFANGTLFASVEVTPTSSYATTGILSGTATFPATTLPIGTLQMLGVYLGSFNDQPSTSAAVPLTVTASDFTLSIAASALSVKTGQTVTLPVLLSTPFTVAVPVALACASPSTAITCSISPTSPTITGTGTATLTLNAFITTTTGSLTTPANPTGRSNPTGPITFALSFAFLILLPRSRKRLTAALFSLILLAAASTLIACGGSGSSGGNPTPPAPPAPPAPPTTTTTNAPTGAYTLVVTATSGGITHNTAVAFNVQ